MTRRAQAMLPLLRPLAERDFALLWAGRAASLVGDGVYVVALAWAVYDLSNVPTALSVVGIALSVPQVALFLLGGVLSDRIERRRALLAADLLRGAAIGAMGVLAVTGALELWHVVCLAALVGVGDALFNPAFAAIVPELVPEDMLVQANALEQFMRPLGLRLAGPTLGGIAVAAVGTGGAFLIDAATFATSAAALLAMRARPAPRSGGVRGDLRAELREGFAYVRENTWLSGGLIVGGFSLLVFWGPFEVLVPFVVRNRLGGSAGDFGLLLAAGGIGGIAASIALSRRGLPERRMEFMYGAWALMMGSLIGYGLIAAPWQGMPVYLFAYAMNTAVLVTWSTVVQSLVPRELLGRVASLDWVVSYALIPLSFAITGPLAAVFGAQTVLVGAGTIGAGGSLLALVLFPGLRDLDRKAIVSAPVTA